MTKKIKKPLISNEVIEYLGSIFPYKCPDINETEKEVWFKSGQRSVVNHLIKEKQVQEET